VLNDYAELDCVRGWLIREVSEENPAVQPLPDQKTISCCGYY